MNDDDELMASQPSSHQNPNDVKLNPMYFQQNPSEEQKGDKEQIEDSDSGNDYGVQALNRVKDNKASENKNEVSDRQLGLEQAVYAERRKFRFQVVYDQFDAFENVQEDPWVPAGLKLLTEMSPLKEEDKYAVILERHL